MPAGLQCFDASGKICVDIVDRQLTWFKDFTFGFTYIDDYLDVSVPDIDPSNTIAILQGSSQIGTNIGGHTARHYHPLTTVVAPNVCRITVAMRYGNGAVGATPTPLTISFFKFTL